MLSTTPTLADRRRNHTGSSNTPAQKHPVVPSTRTLKRLAKATGHRLKISFEPINP
jgi:hypothetical protein